MICRDSAFIMLYSSVVSTSKSSSNVREHWSTIVDMYPTSVLYPSSISVAELSLVNSKAYLTAVFGRPKLFISIFVCKSVFYSC